jgi:23S rRNA (guanine2445-N2)-methyltransferase / 23S rRNA (guanine2069-N7)-methyltransferase
LQWLDEQIKNPWGKQKYDLIFLDPPTFSSSKRMHDTFDVQGDHVELINKVTALLESGGELIFSNNFKKFILDEASLAGLEIKNITKSTLPKDFARNPKIHQCWKIKSA